MMKFILTLSLILIALSSLGREQDKIIYKYKKFQEFDLESLDVTGETGSPSDLSSKSRLQTDFNNKLPLRRNFNPEIRRSVEVIR